MRYVTAADMKEIDRRAIKDCGVPAQRLMENAGKAVAEEACKLIDKGTVLVFCGYGNNGGDGLVSARHLIKKGFEVKVFFVGKPKGLSPETNSNLEKLLTMKATLGFISDEPDIEKTIGKINPALIVDAIFGIGIKGSLDDFYIKLIDEINSIGAPIVSADIPSGLDADSGTALRAAIKASVTVTFGYPKTGFKNPDAEAYVGRLVVANIGFPKDEEGDEQGLQPEKKLKEGTIRVRAGKKGILKAGHPWIFASQIAKPAPGIKPGDIVTVQTADGKFIGRGYYNPKSEISIRLLTFKDETVDEAFFHKKIEEALEKRDLLKAVTNAYRVIFSEADSLPGLIVDLYNETIVIQILTLGMEKFKPIILAEIKDILKPRYIYEKSDSSFRKKEGLKDIKMWHGDKPKLPIEIFEGKVKFLVDVENGHKTGFYLDQRKSRMALEGLCKDKTVLDLFCYTGGFSVSAAVYGARSVEGIDIKEDWLNIARENARLNGVADKSKFIKSDVFAALKDICESGRKFDVIILDPPSFLKDRQSLASASKGYIELNTLAMKCLSEGGILATFSCSHNMPGGVFSGLLKKSALDGGKKISILKRCHQAQDHPIVRLIPETEYLKGYFLKVSGL